MKRPLLVLGIILLLGIFLRLFYLGSIPAGFTPDEASQGYTAYSLLKTGRDEWGLSWPITSFRAFADYRAPLQTYLIIPSVAIFGLNEFAVRLPSAIFGILSILAVYLLANLLFDKKTKLGPIEISLGHVAAFLMAISPWSIQFSRTALEANFASFIFPLGLYLFLRGINDSPKLLYLSAVVFGIDLYSYLAAKLFVPLFILGVVFLNWKKIWTTDRLKRFSIFIIIIGIFAGPIYLDALFGPGNVRGKDLIITNFSLENLEGIKNEQYLSPLNSVSPALTRLFSNKYTFTLRQFVTNYVSYLSPTFLFTEGGRETTYSVFPGFGLLYLWMFPVAIYSLYLIFYKKEKALFIITIWLLLGIIPAAITKEGYRPNRAGSLIGIWEIITAVGLVEILNSSWFKKIKGAYILWTIILISLLSYLNLYFFTSRIIYPDAMSYGYRELMSKVIPRESRYQKIIFDKGSQSQVFVAFYKQMDPNRYQSYSKDWWPRIVKDNLLFLDMLDSYNLDKYTFKSFDPSADIRKGNLVIIKKDKYNPSMEANVVDKVLYADKTVAFYLLTYVEKQ